MSAPYYPTPLDVEEWADLATVLGIPLISESGATFVSVLNSWQNQTAIRMNSNLGSTQSAWIQMVEYVQGLPTEIVVKLQDLLAKWNLVAFNDQAIMSDGGVDSALSGVSWSPANQMMHYAALIKMYVPVFKAGDIIGVPSPQTTGMGGSFSFSR